MKINWIVQLALPWMVSDPEPDFDKQEAKRRKTVSRWSRGCAMALAEMQLRELGTDAKARVLNPLSGEYEAFVMTTEDGKQTTKVYHGREKREKRKPKR